MMMDCIAVPDIKNSRCFLFYLSSLITFVLVLLKNLASSMSLPLLFLICFRGLRTTCSTDLCMDPF